jgi:hypothetical protein
MTDDAPLTPQEVAAAQLRDAKEGYIHRWLVAFDDIAATTADIQNDETISSYVEIEAHKKVWYSFFSKALNAGLDLIQHSHGQLAQVGDISRAQAVLAKDTAALAAEQIEDAAAKQKGESDVNTTVASVTSVSSTKKG